MYNQNFSDQREVKMYNQLAYEERFYIETALKHKQSIEQIATALNRAVSTIRREIQRNRTKAGEYVARHAQQFYRQRQKTKPYQTKITPTLWQVIEAKLREYWSPEQIVHSLKLPISVKSIYAYLHRHFKRKHPIWQCLRRGGKRYVKRKEKRYRRECRIAGAVSIHCRPKEVELKSRLGDWEVDTMLGKGHFTALATLVERKTHYSRIVKLSGKDANDLADKVIEAMRPLKAYIKTLTFDNGTEFAAHKKLADSLECETYFADVRSPWQRGLNENTNGLIRQYFPKGSDLREITEEDILYVERALNTRPRKTLSYQTPESLFRALGG